MKDHDPTMIETPNVSEDGTLTLDSSIVDVLAPIETAAEEPRKQTPGAFMTAQKLMTMIKKMVDSEQITRQQARDMRRKFGISQAYFTGKKVLREKKTILKKITDNSKRINRHNGSTKGQTFQRGLG